MKKLGFLLATLLLASTGWGQTSFTKYGPVNGIQMNTGATPYNFAAGITDIQSLLSASPGVVLGGATGGAKGVGSINATALFINGAAVGTSSGAVSSVGLSVPGTATCLSTTGSPVTSAGTLGLVLGGTTAQYLSGLGTCITFPAIPAAANPSGLIGLTAANGSATTFDRSDATHALDQSIAPTWTGIHTFSQAQGVANRFVVSGPNTGVGWNLLFTDTTNAVNRAFIGIGTNTVGGAAITDFAISPGPSGSIVIGTANGGAIATRFGPNGNVTVNAPASGVTTTENVVAGATYGHVLSGSTSNNIYYNANNGTQIFAAGIGSGNTAFSGTISGTEYDLGTGGNTAIKIAPAGNVTVNPPSSGPALTVSGVSGAQTLIVNAGLNQNAGEFIGANSAGGSFGPVVIAGTNTSDQSFVVQNRAGSANYLIVRGDGSTLIGPTANALTVNGSTGGVVVNSPVSGVAFNATGIASQYAGVFAAAGAAGTQKGLSAVTTTQNAADKIFNVNNSASNLLDIFGDGHGDLGPNLNWTVAGNFTIGAPASSHTLSLNAAAGSEALVINSPNTASSSFGVIIEAGTNSSDYGLRIINAAASTTFFTVNGDGGIQAGAPTGGDKGLGSINMQSCFVNNVACLTGSSSATHFAAGVITIAAGSCTVNQNTADISSCTFNSTGNVTVNFTTAFTSTTCVVNGVNSSPPFAVATQQGSPTTTASNVLMQSSSGVFVNGIFSIMCLGN